MATEAMYLVDPAVQEAIHAPNKTWTLSVNYLFAGVFGNGQDPSKQSSGLSRFETIG